VSAASVPTGRPQWDARGAVPPAYSVSEALSLLADVVATHTPAQVWVAGEVVSVSRSRAGHLYLTLAEGPARLSCVALGRDAKTVAAALHRAGVELAEGVSLRLLGSLAIYPERGSVELRVVGVDPRLSLGSHELARRQARAALAREGLLDAQGGLRLAGPPLKIGIVAPDGAGLGDLESLLGASGWAYRLQVVRCPAEGPAAPERIAASMRLAALDADVVILARGGGTAVRLPYDTEVVARAVATCPVPVITALGHAGDRSLADEVAWRSVATPSAAAGLLNSLIAEADREIVELGREIAAACRRHLERARRDLDHLEITIAQRMHAFRPGAVPHPPAPVATPGERRWRYVALIAAATAFAALMALAIALAVLR